MGRGAQAWAALMLTISAWSGTATALTYNYENIDIPNTTADQPRGINNNGQIVGTAGTLSGAIFGNGPHQITAYSGDLTIPSKINDQGTIVGRHSNAATGYIDHGFVQINGFLLGFDYPASPTPPYADLETRATGINNASLIVGTYDSANSAANTGPSHGFVVGLTSNFPFTAIDYPGAYGTSVVDINDAGIALGYAQLGSSRWTFLYNVNTKTFGLAADTAGDLPTGMNNKLQFVGYRRSALGMPWVGYLYKYYGYQSFGTYGIYLPPSVINIIYPGAADTYPQDINNDGVIVGWYDVYKGGSNYEIHAFRATPVP